MDLKSFVIGLFSGGMRRKLNGQLDQVRQAGSDDAELVVGEYLDAFERRATELLTSRQQRLIGVDQVKVIKTRKAK
jgi:hypothetical protein